MKHLRTITEYHSHDVTAVADRFIAALGSADPTLTIDTTSPTRHNHGSRWITITNCQDDTIIRDALMHAGFDDTQKGFVLIDGYAEYQAQIFERGARRFDVHIYDRNSPN